MQHFILLLFFILNLLICCTVIELNNQPCSAIGQSIRALLKFKLKNSLGISVFVLIMCTLVCLWVFVCKAQPAVQALTVTRVSTR